MIPDEIRQNMRFDIGFPPYHTIEGLETLNWQLNANGVYQVEHEGRIYKLLKVEHLGCWAVAKESKTSVEIGIKTV